MKKQIIRNWIVFLVMALFLCSSLLQAADTTTPSNENEYPLSETNHYSVPSIDDFRQKSDKPSPLPTASWRKDVPILINNDVYEKGTLILKFDKHVDVSTTEKALIAVRQIQEHNLALSQVSSAKPFFSSTLLQACQNTDTRLSLGQWVKITFNDDTTNILSQASEFIKNEHIQYAEPNYYRSLLLEPNDPYYYTSGSWGQDYQDLYGMHIINAARAWGITTGSREVVAAVVDSGVDYTHEDISENMWINTDDPVNGIDDDADGFIDNIYGADFYYNDGNPMDGMGHGTHCAGTIAAVGNNGKGVVGVNWQTRIMAVKGFPDSGSSTDETLAPAVIWAAIQGADVISMSWGSSYGSEVLAEAMQTAFNEGVVLVAAAGNSNSPSTYYPAGYDHVLAVAATDWNDQKAYFSNYGTWIDVCAPGVQILSIRANGTDMYEDGGTHVVGEIYYRASGTSMACPHVAGLAALISAKNRTLTNTQIADRIIATADNIDALNTGYEGLLGSGRINVFQALPLDHNVAIYSIDAPLRGQPDNSIDVNISLLNTGINDETAVRVSFQVNGIEHDSRTIPFFEKNTFQHVGFSWSAPLGWYVINANVTIEAIHEEYYGDNELNRSIIVGVQNLNTSELFSTIQDALDDMQTVNGHTIVVPCGIYRENVNIVKNIVLLGDQRDATYIIPMNPNDFALHIKRSNGAKVSGFTMRNAVYGIAIDSSSNTLIFDNTITAMEKAGLYFFRGSKYNQVFENTFIGNSKGVVLDFTCHDNMIYHNNFENQYNANDDGWRNQWDKGYEGFRPYGGNYWSDYKGSDSKSGPQQNEPFPDGIGDTPYAIPGFARNKDHYPLMNSWSGPLAATIYVDDTNQQGPWDGTRTHPFQTMQIGVNNAIIPEDTVYVFNGTYYENLMVEQPSIRITGENKQTTIVDGQGEYVIVIDVPASNLQISGFTVRNSGYQPWDSGIYTLAKETYIHDNIFTQSEMGVLVYGQWGSQQNVIANNICFDNSAAGIYLLGSNNNVISNNIISDINSGGIGVSGSSYAIVANNTVTECHYAIHQGWGHSYNMMVRGNTMRDNRWGFYGTYPCDNLTLLNNIIENNDEFGIRTYLTYPCTISGNIISHSPEGFHTWLMRDSILTDNTISYCTYGIFLEFWCDRNEFIGNTIEHITENGLYAGAACFNTIAENNFYENNNSLYLTDAYGEASSHNHIYHNNFMDNTQSAHDVCDNMWDIGYPQGGNYWDDYTGVDNYHGPNQNLTGSDGIGDSPYPIPDGDNDDNYPLMNPFGWTNNPPFTPKNPSPPDCSKNVNVYANLSWTGGDPDQGDVVTYDVFFGTTNPPPKVVSNQTNTMYDPGDNLPGGRMRSMTKYYWKIVAWDSFHVSAIGPVWSFKTASSSESPTPVSDE